MDTIYSDSRAVNLGELTSDPGFATYLKAHDFIFLVTFATDKQV